MKILRRMIRKEAGQVMPMALILLLVGGLIIIPTLNFAASNIKSTQNIDLHTRELYAADAGVEDALWYLQTADRLAIINPTGAWPINYNLAENGVTTQINSRTVNVAIDQPWLLAGLPGYTTTLPQTEPAATNPINANASWTVVGAINVTDTTNYIVTISTSEVGTAPSGSLNHIGVWMPRGYGYVTNSVTINGVSGTWQTGGNSLVINPNAPVPFHGGSAYIWNYSGKTFKQLSDLTPPAPGGGVTPAQKYPPSIQLSINYTYAATLFQEAVAFYPWINLTTNNRIAWDTDAGFRHIMSTSLNSATDNTTVEAYVPRGVRRYISTTGGADAIQGDFIVIGNSLMTSCWHKTSGPHGGYTYAPGPPCDYTDPTNERNLQFSESSATIDNPNTVVPSDAKIEKAYLYWTAWWTTNGADTQATLKVNGTLVGTTGAITANPYYVLPTKYTNGTTYGYQYACYADVTDNVTAITTALVGSPPTTFSVSNISAVPADSSMDGSQLNQTCNAAWSMIIIYSSQQPGVGVHQIFVYDHLAYLWGSSGYSEEFTILGFQAPAVGSRDAKLAYFVAEGDPQIYYDYFEFQGQHYPSYVYLGDHAGTTSSNQSNTNPWNNVYNGFSYSTAHGFTPSTLPGQSPGTISGVDLDVYTQDMNGNLLASIIQPNDTQAKLRVRAPRCQGCSSGCDGIMLVFVVFSVTSTAVTPGTQFNVGSMLYKIN